MAYVNEPWVIIIAIVLVGTSKSVALQRGCSEPEERCVLTGHCPTVANRIKQGELSWNDNFKQHVQSKICEPVEKKENKYHICCNQSDIVCELKGEKGVCLLRDECPLLRNTTEQDLMQSAEKNLCYVHDSKKYFCCTDPHCAQKKDALTNPSLFPSCSSDRGVAGILVPKALCGDRSRAIKHASNSQVCCSPPADPNLLIRHRNAAKLADIQCGSTDYQYEIQNDTYAQRGEFPWMARLVYKRRLFCSGTLIHPKYVLTAKHCFSHNPVSVRLGVHNILERSKHEQQISVVELIRSPIYDVGLLRLAKPATLEGSFVRPICLPVYESLRLYLPSTVTIVGWGLTKKGQPVDAQMKEDTHVLTNDMRCTKDHFCTRKPNQTNHCNGESGGPFQAMGTYGGNQRVVQYGVISYGPNDCSIPEQFSRGALVAYIMDWILDNMVL